MKTYFYCTDGTNISEPVQIEDLIQLKKSNIIHDTTQVCEQNSEIWMRLESLLSAHKQQEHARELLAAEKVKQQERLFATEKKHQQEKLLAAEKKQQQERLLAAEKKQLQDENLADQKSETQNAWGRTGWSVALRLTGCLLGILVAIIAIVVMVASRRSDGIAIGLIMLGSAAVFVINCYFTAFLLDLISEIRDCLVRIADK